MQVSGKDLATRCNQNGEIFYIAVLNHIYFHLFNEKCIMKRILLSCCFVFIIGLHAQCQLHNPAQYNVNGVIWQQQSGEYKALCYQAFYIARLRLDDILHTNKDSLPLAVVTDIDEAILDNGPDAAHDILFNHGFADSSWRRWVDLAVANALPGAVEFFNYAAQHGVQCFYISNRDERDKAATMKNLRLRGFPQVDSLHILLKTTTGNKEPRRLDVAAKYNIALLIGDNLNDFDKIFYNTPTAERNAATDKIQSLFGSKYIVLPNATYGDWENALWHGQKPTAEEKDRVKWKALEGY